MNGHWKVYIVDVLHRPPADKNGVHYGVQFTGGFAYVNWKDFANVANVIQQLGDDGRFQVVEIPEADYRGYGTKETTVAPTAPQPTTKTKGKTK